MQVSKADDAYCFFLYGCDWPAGDFHDTSRNSYLGIEWDGVAAQAIICIGIDEDQRLLESKFDSDGNEMVAVGIATGHLQIHGEEEEVETINESQKEKARRFLAKQFPAKVDAGQAEAF